jgi:hypothetical protein
MKSNKANIKRKAILINKLTLVLIYSDKDYLKINNLKIKLFPLLRNFYLLLIVNQYKI